MNLHKFQVVHRCDCVHVHLYEIGNPAYKWMLSSQCYQSLVHVWQLS